MISAYSWFLALRYLLSRWVNLLGMVGVAVAVWALIVVISVFSGFIGEIRQHIRGATPDLLLAGLRSETSFDEVDALVRGDADVVATAPRLRHYGTYYAFGQRYGAPVQATRALVTTPLAFDYVELIGVDPTRECRTTGLLQWLSRIDATPFAVHDVDRPFAVVPERLARKMIGAGMSLPAGGLIEPWPGILMSRRRLVLRGLEPGQPMAVITARFHRPADASRATLKKVRRHFAIAGGFETRHRTFDETTALVPIEELRGMLGHDPANPFSTDVVTEVAIRVRDGADLVSVASRLQAACAPRFGGRVLTWEQQNSVFLGAVDQERAMMKLILFAVMLVAAFLIYATLHMMVTQKTKDIGILSSMGAAPSGVQAIFLSSGIVIAVIGCSVGVMTGILSAVHLNDVNDWVKRHFNADGLFPTDLYALDSIPYRLDADWIAQVVIGALAFSMLAAFLPARRSARMEPVQALAYE